MRIRPGRGRSLFAGVMMLIVMLVGLFLIPGGIFSFPGGGPGPRMIGPGRGVFSLFKILWVVIGLVGAGLSFYNAFSRKGLSLYEIDMDRRPGRGRGPRMGRGFDSGDAADAGDGDFCPQCGAPVAEGDSFCRNCGARL